MFIGAKRIHPRNTKRILATVAAIMIWQFSFPQVTAAETTTQVLDDEPPLITSELPVTGTAETYRLPVNPDKPRPEAKRTMTIPVTAYSSTPDQTSGDPFITASGTHVHDGTIAANFLPIGTRVRFPEYFGDKIFVVEDRMSTRYWHKADIWMETRAEAIQWGVRHTTIEIL